MLQRSRNSITLSLEEQLEVEENLVVVKAVSNVNLRKGTFVVTTRLTTKSAPRNELEREGVLEQVSNLVNQIIEESYKEIDEYSDSQASNQNQTRMFDRNGNVVQEPGQSQPA